MFCNYCGQELPAEARFCLKCGREIPGAKEITCKGCGQKLPGDACFCLKCGQRAYQNEEMEKMSVDEDQIVWTEFSLSNTPTSTPTPKSKKPELKIFEVKRFNEGKYVLPIDNIEVTFHVEHEAYTILHVNNEQKSLRSNSSSFTINSYTNDDDVEVKIWLEYGNTDYQLSSEVVTLPIATQFDKKYYRSLDSTTDATCLGFIILLSGCLLPTTLTEDTPIQLLLLWIIPAVLTIRYFWKRVKKKEKMEKDYLNHLRTTNTVLKQE